MKKSVLPPTPKWGLHNLLDFNKSPRGGFRGEIERVDLFNTQSGSKFQKVNKSGCFRIQLHQGSYTSISPDFKSYSYEEKYLGKQEKQKYSCSGYWSQAGYY